MISNSDIKVRNNVNVIGQGEQTIVLAHGFGCDQQMWRFLTPMLDKNYKVVLFDYVGCGKSDLSSYDKTKYSTLKGYAYDVIEVCEALNLKNVILIGHSVSSIIGMHAAILSPSLFSHLVMVCPSPCFLNFPPEYIGGFEKEDLVELINLMDKNYIGWANYLAPLVMGENNDSEYINELNRSFCSTDPKYAKPFAEATFFSDDRKALSQLTVPSLILQSSNDKLASQEIGRYMQSQISNSKLNIIYADGHCLHMTKPEAVYKALIRFID
ncbi:MAG: sigma-B regulation protein RsbQ [Psychrosphaera sp.]|jgi:sigma-B regulation protein RsbQ